MIKNWPVHVPEIPTAPFNHLMFVISNGQPIICGENHYYSDGINFLSQRTKKKQYAVKIKIYLDYFCK